MIFIQYLTESPNKNYILKNINLVSALHSVSEPIELSAAVEVVEQGVPEKEESPPPVEPGQ